MEKLQEIINEKARVKLLNDLGKLHNLVQTEYYHLFKDNQIHINVGTVDKPKNINLASVFGDSGFKVKLYEANIERYIANESKEFIKQVESIQNQINELYN